MSASARPDEDDSGPDGQETLSDAIDPRTPPSSSSTPTSAAVDADDDVVHFLSIPWCRAHLRPAEGAPAGAASPNVRIILPHARRNNQTGLRNGSPEPAWVPNPDGVTPGGIPSQLLSDPRAFDTIMRRTLNTADTVRAFILFYEEQAPTQTAYRPPVVELKAFLTLGSGMNGHPGVLHGGIVATVLDEVLGLLMPLNAARDRYNTKHNLQPPPSTTPPRQLSAAEQAAAESAHCHHGLVTGYLNTTYVKPVLTLASILVTARFVRSENNRKFYVEGSIWDEKSNLRAKAEAVFIALKQKL